MGRKKTYQIIHEDENLLVVNKESGVLTIADRATNGPSSLKDQLESDLSTKIFTVHRIDRDTSGLVVFARNAEMHRILSLQFQNREVEKEYLALVEGRMAHSKGEINLPLKDASRGNVVVHAKGKDSLSRWALLQQFDDFALLSLRPESGRRHQLRVHLAETGHAILCDPLYGSRSTLNIYDIKKKKKRVDEFEEVPSLLSRLALHAFKITFISLDGESHSYTADLPKDLDATLKQLRKWQS